MRRAFYEWGAIFSLTLLMGTVASWGVDSLSDIANFQLSPRGLFNVEAGAGELLFCDASGNLEVIDLLEKSGVMEPMPLTRRRLSAPGFQFRLYGFADFSIWSLRVSLGWVALLFAGATVYFIRGYRRTRREPRKVISGIRNTWPETD